MRKNRGSFYLDSIYHIYNRGVEKRRIFMDTFDYRRFINDLIIFNDKSLVLNPKQRIKDIKTGLHKRIFLVDILAFCLMPNHYHILLRQRVDGGITEFMRKMGGGYVNYFNLKHQRVGTLFQGKFKSILINTDAQFLYIPFYIHLNPLDLNLPNWRTKGVSNIREAIKFLKNYQWSSHLDYLDRPSFQLVLNKNLIDEYFYNSTYDYGKSLEDFLKDFAISDLESSFLLE